MQVKFTGLSLRIHTYTPTTCWGRQGEQVNVGHDLFELYGLYGVLA